MNILAFIKKLLGFRYISNRTREMVLRDWEDIKILKKGSSPSQLKQALINADRSLDSILKDLITGTTMGERLKNAKGLFNPQTYDQVWSAHKMRNSLVHESGFEASSFIIKSSIEHLQSACRELGVKL